MSDALLDAFLDRFLAAVADSAKVEALPRIRSRTLAQAMQVTVERPTGQMRIRLRLPFYWAVYDHEGRDAIRFPPGRYMVFFPDIKDDPRVDGGADYPATRADRRHLSREQFRRFSQINRARAKLGQEPIMVVTQRVGPAEGRPGIREAVEEISQSGLIGDLASATITQFLKETALSYRDRAVLNL